MTTASLFKNGRNQAVRIPKELEFSGISEVEVRKEGNSIILTPVRKSWKSFINEPLADEDFLNKREDVLKEGDEIEVKLIEVDPKTNKLRLSRKALLERPPREPGQGSGSGDHRSHGRRPNHPPRERE